MLVSKYDLYRDLYDQAYKTAIWKREYNKTHELKRMTDHSHIWYQREIASLSIDLGRQTGKTTFIVDMLLHNPKAIVIVMKEMWVKEYIRMEPRIKDQVFGPSSFINKFYGRGMSSHVVCGRSIPSYEIVFLDEPKFFCTQDQKNYTNRDSCSYPDSQTKLNLEELILYASYKMGAVNLMVGMK